ncbi:SCO family protein [Roseomonas sp. HF4]|uniref:SCO family protein n=1 Tax=Roseomonas sp. HF4 TaxID=2562313 RepID=UPI0010BF9E0F|nr:SCO family protein [Roseomonas sp. HF4]
MLRIIRWVAWGAVGVVGFLLLATTGGWLVSDGPLAPPRVATGPQTLAIGGPFSLTDHRGRAVTERDFRGRPTAVFFGFTYCPDVCPTTLTEMTGFIEAMGAEADRVHWLFVSVDSERDTPQAMAGYLEAFDRRITGLSGTEAEIARVAQSFRVYYRRVPVDGGGYTMDHSASIFLLDASGRFAGTIDHKESERVALEKLRLLTRRD